MTYSFKVFNLSRTQVKLCFCPLPYGLELELEIYILHFFTQAVCPVHTKYGTDHLETLMTKTF